MLPYRADSLGKLVLRHQNDTPKRLRAIDPDIPEAVAEVIARALAKEVDDRYQSMAELREELLAATKGMTPEPLDQVVASDGEKELATELTMPATGDQIVATAETMAAEETGPPPLDEDAAQGDDEEEDVSQLETVHRASNTTLSASSGETARHSVVTEVDAGGKGKLLGGIAAAALVLIGLAAYFGMDSGPARDPSPPTAPAAASRAPRPAPPAPKPGGAAEAADGPGPGSSGQAGGRPAASHGDRHHHPGADPGRRRRHPGRLTGQGHQDQAPPGKPAAHPEGEPRRLPGRAAPVRGQQ